MMELTQPSLSLLNKAREANFRRDGEKEVGDVVLLQNNLANQMSHWRSKLSFLWRRAWTCKPCFMIPLHNVTKKNVTFTQRQPNASQKQPKGGGVSPGSKFQGLSVHPGRAGMTSKEALSVTVGICSIHILTDQGGENSTRPHSIPK